MTSCDITLPATPPSINTHTHTHTHIHTHTHPHTHSHTHTHTHTHTHNVARWSLFQLGGTDSLQYWHVISRLAPTVSVGSVQDMEEIQTELGKVGGCLSAM